MNTPMSRRSVLGLAGATAAALATAGCGTSGPGGDHDTVQLWVLQNDVQNPVLKSRIDAYNSTSDSTIKMTTYVNDPYKQKLQVAMGSPNAPDIFFNWGGGNLAQYVDAKQVLDLGPTMKKHPKFADSFVPTVLDAGKVDGKQYGIPMSGMQPTLLFYNKKVFAEAGKRPPTTYQQLLSLIDAFRAKNITPIALAGSQGWTELMYLMYLTDRIGGPTVAAAIADGKPGAWRDPAVRAAAQHCHDLVKRGAFGDHYSSVDYDNNGASKLLATGKAAMQLMGSWEYQTQLGENPDFISSDGLGWVAFPKLEHADGDPRNVVGVPANFFSVTASSKHHSTAIDFLVKTLTADKYLTGLIGEGEIPAVTGIKPKLTGDSKPYTTFVYDLVSKAPSFTMAWDQAVTPSVGSALNTNLQKLFLSQLTPAAFVTAMDKAK